MWIISQGHPFRDSCGVREDQLPVVRVRTGVSDGVLFVMCMSDGPAMIGGASQLPSKDLEPALHGAGEFGRHAVSPIITARKERPSLSILRSCRGKACTWAIIRHPGRAVMNCYEVHRPECTQFWIMRPGEMIKIRHHR